MKIKVLLFSYLAEKAGKRNMEITDVSDSEELMKKIYKMYPEFQNLPLLISLNQEVIHSNAILKDGDEIALMPPFAGG